MNWGDIFGKAVFLNGNVNACPLVSLAGDTFLASSQLSPITLYLNSLKDVKHLKINNGSVKCVPLRALSSPIKRRLKRNCRRTATAGSLRWAMPPPSPSHRLAFKIFEMFEFLRNIFMTKRGLFNYSIC